MSTLKVNTIRHTGASSDAVTLATDGTCTAKITNNLSNRNLIINGEMQVAQRGTQTSLSSGSSYGGCDRWKVQPSNLGTWTLGQDTTDAPKNKGFNTCLKLDCTTADASPAAGDYLILQQGIEGYLCNQLAYGQSTAKSVTLSFWCKAEINGWSSGTKSFVAELQAGSTTYESGNLITLTTNDTWQKVSCTFPGMTGQAIASTSNDLGIMLNLWLDAGSNWTTGSLSTSWDNKGNADRAAGLNLRLGAHTDNNFFMTGVQLEVGEVATDFEHRSYGDELAKCQRYYEVLYMSNGTACCYATGDSTYKWAAMWYFKQEKRAQASVALLDDAAFTVSGGSGITLTGIFTSKDHAMFYYDSGLFRLGDNDQHASVKAESEI